MAVMILAVIGLLGLATMGACQCDPPGIGTNRVVDGKTIVPLLCGGARHQEPRLHRAKLVALLQQALHLAAACMPDLLVEFEINPLVPTAHGVVALDALARLGPGARPGPTGSAGGTPVASGIESGNTSAGVMSARSVSTSPDKPLHKLARLLQPRSIAIVGVSEKMNVGHIILNNCLHAGFDPERIYVVKPGTARLEGCRCVPNRHKRWKISPRPSLPKRGNSSPRKGEGRRDFINQFRYYYETHNS